MFCALTLACGFQVRKTQFFHRLCAGLLSVEGESASGLRIGECRWLTVFARFEFLRVAVAAARRGAAVVGSGDRRAARLPALPPHSLTHTHAHRLSHARTHLPASYQKHTL